MTFLRVVAIAAILLIGAGSVSAASYWEHTGVYGTLLGGGLFGLGMKAKTTSRVAFEFAVMYSPEFMWEASTDEEDTGASIGYFAQVDYYLTDSEIQHYLLFRVGYDQIAYELMAVGYGVEWFVTERLALFAEAGLGYRPAHEAVENRVQHYTGKETDVGEYAPLLKVGVAIY